MKRKKVLRVRLWVLMSVICVSLFGVIYSTVNILLWCYNVEQNNKIRAEIKEEYVEEIIIDQNISGVVQNDYSIDFDSVKKRNKDTVGYLVVNGLDVSNFIVKAKDNDYYLKHNFDKKYSSAGWIFADYHNKFDGSDKNIIIYGHNTKNGSMFGTLKNIFNKEWYSNEDNLVLKIITPTGEYKYRVFSTYTIKPEDYYINTEFKNNKEYIKFVETLKKRSTYDFKVDTSKVTQILTLSSCRKEGKERVVLHAMRLD